MPSWPSISRIRNLLPWTSVDSSGSRTREFSEEFSPQQLPLLPRSSTPNNENEKPVVVPMAEGLGVNKRQKNVWSIPVDDDEQCNMQKGEQQNEIRVPTLRSKSLQFTSNLTQMSDNAPKQEMLQKQVLPDPIFPRPTSNNIKPAVVEQKPSSTRSNTPSKGSLRQRAQSIIQSLDILSGVWKENSIPSIQVY